MKAAGYLKNVDAIVAAIAGYFIVYLFTKYNGIGISPDAVVYTSTARNLHANGSLNFFNNQPIVDFPVFYPVFLAFIYLISSADPVIAGPVLNGLLFACVLFISGWLMQRFALRSLIYKWLILLLILLSPALLQVYTYLWSETLFILLILLFFIALCKYLNKRTTTALIFAACLAALAGITRYAGVTVIGTGGLLLLTDRAVKFKHRLLPLLIFCVVASSLLTANLLRNRMVSGNSTGPRETSVTSLSKNLAYFGSTVCNWFTLADTGYTVSLCVGVFVILFLLASMLYHAFKARLNAHLIIAVAFSLVYGLFIIISSTFSRYENINNRLLSPMYIPLLWALSWWVIHLPYRWPKLKRLPLYAFVIIGTLVIIYRLGKIDYQRYDDQFDYGNPGYTDDTWKTSEIVTYLRKNKNFFNTGVPIYADAYEAVYFFTGQKNVKLLPHLYFSKETAKFFAQKHFYLIWFKDLDNPELIDLNDISRKKKLKKLQQFTDGALYEYNEADIP